MSPADVELLKRFRQKCKEMELKAVDFLDQQGGYASTRRQVTAIRCTFIDGVKITVPRRLEKFFDKQVFKLRPARDNA